jgi:hypothetical protein
VGDAELLAIGLLAASRQRAVSDDHALTVRESGVAEHRSILDVYAELYEGGS